MADPRNTAAKEEEALGERHPAGPEEVGQLNPVSPDAVSPEVRSDGDGAVIGGGTRDTGAGTVGGRDAGGPGGREPLRRSGVDEAHGAASE